MERVAAVRRDGAARGPGRAVAGAGTGTSSAATDRSGLAAASVVTSLYVHVPFCARRCRYCDFAIRVGRRAPLREWLEAIAGEARALEREGLASVASPLKTLYVGGGTPSLLGPAVMDGLAAILGPERLAAPELEWSAEANPESFTREVAAAWWRAGVNRVSLGVQSFHAEALRWMGRLHGPEGAEEAVRIARESGFENVNIDLIFGLPAHLGRSWVADLERALALGPNHMSLYGLSVEAGTPLARAVESGRELPVEEEQYRDEYLFAVERITAAGYRHYEVSNFALPGWESRHNRVYWSGAPYLGLGNGAHSYVPPLRRWNLRDWPAYRSLAARGELPVEAEERIEGDTLRLERIWLGLRAVEGLDPRTVAGSGDADAMDRVHREVCRWEREGWATWVAGRVRLTPEGWLLLDQLAVQLDAAVAAGLTP